MDKEELEKSNKDKLGQLEKMSSSIQRMANLIGVSPSLLTRVMKKVISDQTISPGKEVETLVKLTTGLLDVVGTNRQGYKKAASELSKVLQPSVKEVEESYNKKSPIINESVVVWMRDPYKSKKVFETAKVLSFSLNSKGQPILECLGEEGVYKAKYLNQKWVEVIKKI